MLADGQKNVAILVDNSQAERFKRRRISFVLYMIVGAALLKYAGSITWDIPADVERIALHGLR